MNSRLFCIRLLLAMLTPCICLASLVAATPSSRPPNILLIMADDLGYNDLHVYNNNPLARTPNIDQLAREGVRFNRHYTDAVCSPSRAALLTGLFPARLAGRAGPRGISSDVTTLADSLRAAGYRTHHIGKWHVRSHIRDAWPDRQGFDTYFGFINQLLLDGKQHRGKHVYNKARYHNPWLSTNGAAAREYEGHLTDLLAANAIESINAFVGEQPWFINFWALAPHHPTQPAAQWAGRYPDTLEGRYYALVQQLDHGIGRVLEALEASGQRDNTIVVFTSDNGGLNLGTDNNAPLHGRKSQYNEGGVRTPLIMAWPGHYPQGAVVQQPVGIIDLFPTLARAAGARIPENIDGYDISPAMTGGRLPPRAQYYEIFRNGAFGFSVLSADGRWRLYLPEDTSGPMMKGHPRDPILYDLHEDPTGHHNVHGDYPAIVEQLSADYRRWHRSARELRLNSRPVERRGLALTGSDLQRTPGYGGFTFAIAYGHPAGAPQPEGTLAEQVNAWSLTLNGDRKEALLSFGDYSLKAPVTPGEVCNSLIATSYFKITTLQARRAHDEMIMELYHNGVRIGRHHEKGIEETIHDTSQATTVGYSAFSDSTFNARLRAPVVLNAYTSTATPITAQDLHRELCGEPSF